jgi:hypothetical protein
MGCLKLTYHPEPTLFLDEQGEGNEPFKLEVWVNPERGFSGVDEEVAQQNNPNIIYVYSPDQVGRIRNANDGLALYIAMYGVNNQFVDGKGNPSNYAERLFKKTHPNSKISFPANGNSAQFVPGGSLDIMIKGLNFKTGQFDDLRTIHIQSDRDRTDALMRGIFEVIMEHGADYLIEKIFRLPPIILPPGYFNDPLGPPNQGG